MSATAVTSLLTVGSNGPRRKLTLTEANLYCLKATARDCELAAVVDFGHDRFQVSYSTVEYCVAVVAFTLGRRSFSHLEIFPDHGCACLANNHVCHV